MRLLSCSIPCCEISNVTALPIHSQWWTCTRLLAACTLAVLLAPFVSPAIAAPATGTYSAQPVYLFGIPVDFILFGLTLLGVAIFHHKTLQVALTGLAVVTLYKLVFTGFRQGPGFSGLALQMQHEWVILANLFLLLMGFAILSRHFESSRIPDEMPGVPAGRLDRRAPLLVIVFVLSELPRQHRSGLDRRHDGSACVQGQSAYRLSCRHRRSVERWRCRQRRWRYHHHHDVDRRRKPAPRCRSLCRRDRRFSCLQHSCGDPAASPLADREGLAAQPKIDWISLAIVAAILVTRHHRRTSSPT